MEKFYTILTNAGKSSIINATLLNKKVEFTHLVLGDANGTYYNPSENQERLINEVWRGQISNVKVDEENPNWIIIETIVPASDGGFMIREAGILDETGNLLIIGKHPETYKPRSEDGSVKDLIIRMTVEISNTQAVTLKINPAIVLATKLDVMEMGKTKADKVHNHNDLYHTKSEISTLLDNKITITPPIQSPFTSDTRVICSKSCTNVVCLNITVKNYSSGPIWGGLFTILPVGFRPSEYTSAIAIYNINGDFHVSHISVNENGELKASIPYGNGVGSCSFSFIAKK